MTALAVVSAKGAPGVTTSAVLLAAVWPTPALLVEADRAGGDLRSWFTDRDGQPLRPDLGVVSLLATHRTGSGSLPTHAPDRSLAAHAQTLPGGLQVLVGPSSPAQAQALTSSWPALADTIASSAATFFHTGAATATGGVGDGDVIVDAGRVTATDPDLSMLRACALTLVVCRATVAATGHTRDLLTALHHAGVAAEVLVLGSAAAREEVTAALHLYDAQVHRLPLDPTAAAGVTGTWSRRLDRSPLVAATRHLTRALHARSHPTTISTTTTAAAAGADQDADAMALGLTGATR